MSWQSVTRADSIAAGAAKEFTIETAQGPLELFIINTNGQFHAYKNRCPHTGVTLNWLPSQFLDIDNRYIQCSTHGALFRIQDGYCVRGPCAGASLTSLPLKIEHGTIWVEIA
ncbi:MAG: Rieske (2Fe-2S) protein [Gammaproteobacteria bacterium]|nr:Rieske (2Fe-2S) protein [Gammaproteobacteria bacterium]